MGMIQVDLEDSDGVIQLSLAVDQGFWASYGGWAVNLAAQYGITAVANDYAPAPGAVSGNVYGYQDWSAQIVGAYQSGSFSGEKGGRRGKGCP
jgi:hypothetical protein